jgi:Predicted oxidoreductase
LKEGDTLEALAEEIDVDAEGLKAAIEKYNASAAAGVDEDFGRPYIIIAMETPKYYACKIEPALHGTYGGVSISINGEALDAEGNVIPGLYAAGCVADMRVWSTNPTMHAPGAFGHIAAQHIIENS